MDSVTAWLNTAGDNAIDWPETAELLTQLARTTDEGERNKLINKVCIGNLKLVYSTVKSYSDKRRFRWGTDLSADLLQVGFLGLRHAVSRYDVKFGTRLSTIAVPWIRQKVGRHVIKKEGSIYIPENLVREVAHLNTHGTLKNGRNTPKNTQLVELARYAYAAPLSLDKPMNENEDGAHFGEMLIQRSEESYESKSNRKYQELKDLLAKAEIEPKTQDLFLAYARRGRLSIAAAKCKLNPKQARHLVDETIARIQKVV